MSDTDFRFVPAPAGWSPARLGDAGPKAVLSTQSGGQKGVRESLRLVAKIATEGMEDWRTQAWASHKLKDGGNPQDAAGRCRVLLEAIHKEKIWIPDPHGTERLVASGLMLGDGVNAPHFAGGDCDDLVVSTLGAVLACTGAIGCAPAVIGHSYRSDKQISHVLGAVHIDGNWYYLEPSSKDYAFGTSKKATWEIVIMVPSQQQICDAESCITSSLNPEDYVPEGRVQVISGLGDLGTLGAEEPSTALARLGDTDWSTVPVPPVAQATGASWDELYGAIADDMEIASNRARRLYDDMTDTLDTFGLPRFGTTGFDWTQQNESDMVNALAAAGFIAQSLRECVQGTRHAYLLPADATKGLPARWGIEAKSADTFAITVTSTGFQLTGNYSSANAVQGLGIAPLAIAGLIAAVLAYDVIAVYAVKTVMENLTEIIGKVTTYKTNDRYIGCIQSGDCTPAQASALAGAIGNQAKAIGEADAAKKNADNAVPLAALTYGQGIAAGVVVAVVVGGILWYVTKKQGVTIVRRGAKAALPEASDEARDAVRDARAQGREEHLLDLRIDGRRGDVLLRPRHEFRKIDDTLLADALRHLGMRLLQAVGDVDDLAGGKVEGRAHGLVFREQVETQVALDG